MTRELVAKSASVRHTRSTKHLLRSPYPVIDIEAGNTISCLLGDVRDLPE